MKISDNVIIQRLLQIILPFPIVKDLFMFPLYNFYSCFFIFRIRYLDPVGSLIRFVSSLRDFLIDGGGFNFYRPNVATRLSQCRQAPKVGNKKLMLIFLVP